VKRLWWCGVVVANADSSIGDGTGMNCVDIVIGAAVGELSRVGDYYTADRSTPRHDQFYGGSQSLTAAVANQSDDGMTTVIFRRPLTGTHASSSLRRPCRKHS